MAYTTAQRKKFFELVDKYANASIYNNEAKDLSRRIAQMAKSPQGLNELAQLVTEDLEEEMKAYDIRPLLFGPVKQREINDRVEYRRKGRFRAYRIDRGGYVPKSQIFQDTVTVMPEQFAVRPSCQLDQLESGRISAVQDLRNGARDALLTEYSNYYYETFDEIGKKEKTPETYAEVTDAVDKQTLDAMLYTVSERGTPIIVGTHQSLAPILDFDGHTESMKDEIQRTGSLGMYRGARIVKLEQFTDADNLPVISNDKIFVMSEKIGHIDDFGKLRYREVVDGDHDELSIVIRREMGLTILYPERFGMIQITKPDVEG